MITAHVFHYTAGDQTDHYTPPKLNGADTITQYTYNVMSHVIIVP
ncbi:MAG TPA: hypothetical protein PLE99_01495 [Candidatus Thiothrix moscowensis]|nr:MULTISPECIES: hypothetical protein [unclassified Thiothrix]HRJ51411.1 hypothetical protein [Candidatus Thiothrix moscowensis]HRJ91534.1 hypothetical protein [Candidatus Thiothrix moscowensis]